MYGPGRAQSSGPGSRAGPPGTSRSLAVFGVGKPGGTRLDCPLKPAVLGVGAAPIPPAASRACGTGVGLSCGVAAGPDWGVVPGPTGGAGVGADAGRGICADAGRPQAATLMPNKTATSSVPRLVERSTTTRIVRTVTCSGSVTLV